MFIKHSSGTSSELTKSDATWYLIRQWAPTVVSSTSLSADAVRTASVDAWGATPYDETAYEASPRGMPQTVTRAGATWHNSGKKTVTAIYANDARTYACPLYTVASDGVSTSGNWAAGRLRVEVTVDEDGMRTETYTDMRGLTVRVKHGGAATDYVYDGYGDLRYVLPPGVSGIRKRTDARMKSLAYWYDYDMWGRMVTRKLPGCREEKFMYDIADRLVAEQTRDLPSGTWRLYGYDRAGRRVLAIDCPISDLKAENFSISYYTAALSSDGLWAGYKLTPSFSLPAASEVVWANYYDTYMFVGMLGLGSDFGYQNPFTALGLGGRAPESQRSLANSPGSAKGKLTGVYTGEGYESIYYDSRGQELERHSTGFGRGWTVTFHTYDGQPLSVHRVYGKYNGGKLPDRDTYYSYDPGGRVVKVRHVERIRPSGSTTERVDSAVISTEWNPLGQVGAVRLGTGARRTIGYDVHGWVRATGTSTGSGELYEYIRYADDTAGPRYNGFISRRQWGKLNGFSHTYDYTYDGNGFLTKASGDGNTHSVSYAYDSRGNMLSMTRRGVTDMLSGGLAAAYGVLDDVAASYSGNRLTGLAVTSGAKTFSRRTGIGRAGSFSLSYDESGRLVSDASRGISSIGYDGNGHALSVLYSDGSAHRFNRDGLGNLTGTVYMERCGGTSGAPVVRVAEEREYTSGGHVIVNGRLVMSRFGGGYFDGSGNPHYYVTDWQGNNIGLVDRNGLLEQRTRSGALKEYRFPASDYVPGFPRFATIDPMCEGTPWLRKV